METLLANGFLSPDFLTPFLLVFLGAGFQVATGVGLGLIAGPGLLFVLDGAAAVQIAIVLNLVLTVFLLPSEFRDAHTGYTSRLCLWSIVGIPIGIAFLLALSPAPLKLIGGIVVLLAAVQLRLTGTALGLSLARHIGFSPGGVVSGIMTGALAVPGPVALWTLLNKDLDVQTVRASLRVYFLIAYSVALVLHLLMNGPVSGIMTVHLILLPALFLGMALGTFTRTRISSEALRVMLEWTLILMGASLLFKGVWDVF